MAAMALRYEDNVAIVNLERNRCFCAIAVRAGPAGEAQDCDVLTDIELDVIVGIGHSLDEKRSERFR